jgi:hypothetical protein
MGLSRMNFKAKPPFNEMRQGFATFKKETRMAQYLPELFENLPGYWISLGNHVFFSQHPGSSIQHHLVYSDSREVRVKNDDPKNSFLKTYS